MHGHIAVDCFENKSKKMLWVGLSLGKPVSSVMLSRPLPTLYFKSAEKKQMGVGQSLRGGRGNPFSTNRNLFNVYVLCFISQMYTSSGSRVIGGRGEKGHHLEGNKAISFSQLHATLTILYSVILSHSHFPYNSGFLVAFAPLSSFHVCRAGLALTMVQGAISVANTQIHFYEWLQFFPQIQPYFFLLSYDPILQSRCTKHKTCVIQFHSNRCPTSLCGSHPQREKGGGEWGNKGMIIL